MDIPKLQHVNVYLTWQCNFHCIHCWVDGSTEAKKYIDKNLLFSFIEQAKLLGLKSVKLTGGEPLLHSEIEEIIEFIGDSQLNITIETNGSLLSNSLIDIIKKYNVNLSISLNGYNSITNDSFTKHNGSFNTVISKIKLCVDNNINIEIVTCAGKYNVNYIEQTLLYLDDLKTSKIKINPINSCGRADEETRSDLVFSNDEYTKFLQKYKLLRTKLKTELTMMIPYCLEELSVIKMNNLCACGGINLLSFLPNGELSLCGYAGIDPDIVLCNFEEVLLKDVWESNPMLLNLRSSFTKFDGVCSKCIHKIYCNSLCKAMVYKEYKRWNAPYPICNYLYQNDLFPKSRLIPQVSTT